MLVVLIVHGLDVDVGIVPVIVLIGCVWLAAAAPILAGVRLTCPVRYELSALPFTDTAAGIVTALPAAVICPYLSIVIGYTAEVVFAGDVLGAACLIITLPLVPLPVNPSLPVTPVIVPALFVEVGIVNITDVPPAVNLNLPPEVKVTVLVPVSEAKEVVWVWFPAAALLAPVPIWIIPAALVLALGTLLNLAQGTVPLDNVPIVVILLEPAHVESFVFSTLFKLIVVFRLAGLMAFNV